MVAFFTQECNGISGLGAGDGALFMVGTLVAAFQITPEIDHFAFDSDLSPWVGQCENPAKGQHD